MAAENLKIDQNTRTVLGAITNDANQEIRNVRVNPITGALIVEASITSTNTSIGSTIPGGTQGSVLFLGAGGTLAQDNANLFYNDTSNFFGLGTNAPAATLHVVGTTRLNFGSDATGDVFYRSAGGNLQRLGIGSAGEVLTVAGGIPVWDAAPGTTGYTTIDQDGAPVTERSVMNFVDFFTITDNAPNTDIEIDVVALGSDATFVTTIANDATFLSQLTANATFISDITTIVNNAGSSIQIDLADQVTGVLPLANGGTGAALSDPGSNRAYVWDDTTNATRLAILDGLTYDSASNTLTAADGGSGYDTIQTDGTPVAQEDTINFSPFFDVTDDAGVATDVTIDVVELANDTTFINELTSNSTFQNAVNSFVTGGSGGSSKIYVDTTQVTVNGTSTETIIYTANIPGGTLGSNNAISFRVALRANFAAGTLSDSVTIRAKYGGTLIGSSVLTQDGTAVLNLPGAFAGIVVADDSTGDQKGDAEFTTDQIGVTGGGANQVIITNAATATSSVDSTVDQDLVITVQHGSGDTDLSTIVDDIIVEGMSGIAGSGSKKVGVGEISDIGFFNTQIPFLGPPGTTSDYNIWDLNIAGSQLSSVFVNFGDQEYIANNADDFTALLPDFDNVDGELKFSSGKQTIFQTVATTNNGGANQFESGIGFEVYGSGNWVGAQGSLILIGAGFVRRITDGQWFAKTADGVASTETAITISDAKHVFRCEYDPGNVTPQVRFYVDGILLATITTNLPTASNAAIGFCIGNGTNAGSRGITTVSVPSFTVEI